MKNNQFEKKFLWALLIINAILLIPIMVRKAPIKDWVIVFIFNAVTNLFTDTILTTKKVVKYPVRFLPKIFNAHLLFDLLVYPTATVIYNQITYKDKPINIFKKLFYFVIPALLIEFWAERKTNLIKWSNKWKWYHTFLGLLIKSLKTRLFIALLRKLSSREKSSVLHQ